MRWLAVALGCSGCALVDGLASKNKTASDAAVDATIDTMVDAMRDAPGPDGADPRFACAGAPPATSAPSQVTVSGTIESPFMHTESGVLVQLRQRSNESVVASNTSGANSTYSATANTGNVPIDVYLHLSRADLAISRAYPSEPVFKNLTNLELVVYTSTDLTNLALIGETTYDSSKATVGALVLDCLGTPVPNATIVVTPSPTKLVYVGLTGPDPQLTVTSSFGSAIAYNVPPSATVTVQATAGSATFGPVNIRTIAGEVALTSIHP